MAGSTRWFSATRGVTSGWDLEKTTDSQQPSWQSGSERSLRQHNSAQPRDTPSTRGGWGAARSVHACQCERQRSKRKTTASLILMELTGH